MSAPGTVTLSEAARRSGLSTTQLRRWIQAGKLPSATRQLDGSYSIAVAELIAALPPGSWDKVTATPDAQTVTPTASQTVSADAQTVTPKIGRAHV